MITTFKNLLGYLNSKRESFRFNLLVIAVVCLVLWALGIFYPSTKLGFLLVIILAVVNPRLRGFGFDFLPFMALLFTYTELRRFADDFTGADINVVNLIKWEKALFGGTLPGHWLQSNLGDHFFTPVIDVLTNTFYLSHFITPLILAAVLWYFRRPEYWAFMIGLVVLSFAAFLTYLVFPAAPPWWATSHGYLRTEPITLDSFIVSRHVVASGPNPVAAMPSLHIAYPTYLALVSMTVWGRRGLPVLILPLGVAFSAIYLGHHYVIDGLVGATYALFVYLIVYWSLRKTNIDLNVFAWTKAHSPQRVANRRYR